MATRPVVADSGWVTLTEACRLLGVSPSTVRRWGDTGVVRTFITPGGHRRFSRAGLEAMLPDRSTGRPSLGELGESPDRMVRGYRRSIDGADGGYALAAALAPAQREQFRGYGRGIVTALLAALGTDDQLVRGERLRDAEATCAQYGRIAAREGLPVSMTADLFLRFRRPFVAELRELAGRREFDAPATSRLMADAHAALDGLLIATLRAWELAEQGQRTARRSSIPEASRSSS
jgi:excisionase family DNA binding protein